VPPARPSKLQQRAQAAPVGMPIEGKQQIEALFGQAPGDEEVKQFFKFN